MLNIRKTLHSSQIYLLQSTAFVSRQFLYAGHTENVEQQSDLFAAVKTVCKQLILCAEHAEHFAQQSDIFAAVSVVCVHAEIFTQQSNSIAAVNTV